MATIALAFLLAIANAKFAPFAPGYGDDGNLELDRRHSWCDLQDVSLAGRSVSVALLPQLGDLSIEAGKLQETFLVKVFEEVSRRAGFTWHATTAVITRNSNNFDDLILGAALKYDVALAGIMSTPARKRQGLIFGYSLFDASPVFVTQVKKQDPSISEWFFAFLKPFQAEFWYALLTTFVTTALIYAYLEWDSEDFKEGYGYAEGLLHSFWLSLGSFTSAASFSPSTKTGKTFVLTWTFCLVLVVAAYTANLAQLLIIKQDEIAAVANIGGAVSKRLPICVDMNSAAAQIVRTLYPTAALVDTDGSQFQPRLLLDGICVGAVTANWHVYESQSRNNPGCQFDVRGKRLQEVHASFAATGDMSPSSAGKCTGKLLESLDYYTHQVYRDGFVTSAWESFLLQHGDQDCNSPTHADDDVSSLSVKDMSGVLVIYAFMSIACVLLRFFVRCWPAPSYSDTSDEGTSDQYQNVNRS